MQLQRDEILDKDEVLKMARQADFCVSEDGKSISTNNSYGIIQYELEAFAKLVAAKAVEREREACAKTVETIETYEKIEKACFKFAAKTIRARGQL